MKIAGFKLYAPREIEWAGIQNGKIQLVLVLTTLYTCTRIPAQWLSLTALCLLTMQMKYFLFI